MAVTSQLTSLENFNGTPTLVGYGGGQAASTNTDIFIEGTQSAGRRVDNTTNKGHGASFTSADLSAANEHVKVWAFVTQWASVTQVQVRISSGADDDHELPTAEYPDLGGFIPIWVDVSRTPEVGGSANEASIAEVGVLIDIGDVGGNAQNLIVDEIMHGTSGLLWDGTGGDFDDFRTYESSNNEGALVTLNGVDFCYARLEIGSATATGFTDSGFTLIFPDQALVSSTFMGLTIDLQNASTAIDLSDAVISSSNVAAATNRPDILVTGTSGTFDMTSVSALGLRTIELTSGCTLDGCTVETVAMLQGSADVENCTIRTRAATSVATLTDPTFGSTTDLHDTTFVQAGSGHAIEIDTATTYTFTNLFFSGYGADTTDSAALDITASSGTVTINVQGGDTPTYKTAGATVVINNTVTVKVTTEDKDTGSAIEGARVRLEAAAGGDLTVGAVILDNLLTNASGIAQDTGFNFTNNQPVTGVVRKGTHAPVYVTAPISGTITSTGFDFTAIMDKD